MSTVAQLMADARRVALAESRILREACDPADTPTPHLTYKVAVTCPRCGGPLHHVTGSREPRNIGLEAKAVCKCDRCCDTYIVTVAFQSQLAAQRACSSIQRETERAMST